MNKTRRTLTTSAIIASALVAAPVALAGGSTQLGSRDDVQITGAYAYKTKIKTSTSAGTRNLPYLVVVARTQGEMPRRFDGMIRASVTVDGAGGARSTSSVGKKESACYETAYRITDGRIRDAKGNAKSISVANGKQLIVRVTTKDADGKKVSDKTKTMIRKYKPGDKSGKSLGC